MSRSFSHIVLATLSTLMFAGMACTAMAADDPVLFHFDTMGDSRQAPGDPGLSPQDSIWLQDTRVLARVTREVQAGHAQAFVFNGDMIYGYSSEQAPLDKEYAYWRGMMAMLMEGGTYVLPVPGNHEMQIKRKDAEGNTRKVAIVSSEQAWRANMGDLILNEPLWASLTGLPAVGWNVGNAPTIGNDGITTDQRQLSYSFDAGPVHIAVINTDPVGFDGSAPVHWLQGDLAAAKARGATHFFVFGHKMAYAYLPPKRDPALITSETGLETRPPVRDAFWDLIESYHATYFCGHEHVFHAWQPRKNTGGSSWQVIVGSGGSPFGVKPEESDNPVDRSYAWADVNVFKSGRVHVTILGFDEHFGPTHVITQWDMAQ